jgi:hypothetical protein
MSFPRRRADHAQRCVLAQAHHLHCRFLNDRRVPAFIAEQRVDRVAVRFRGASAPPQGVEIQRRFVNGDDAHAVFMNGVRFNPQSARAKRHAGVEGMAPHQRQPERGGGDLFQHRSILLPVVNLAIRAGLVMRNVSLKGQPSCT